jgi:hypothetical protein
LWAQGQSRFESVTGSGVVPGAQHHGIREDNVVAGSGTASQAWGRGLRDRRRHRLGSGKMTTHKGLDHGQERWSRGSGEDSTMARMLGEDSTTSQALGRSTIK